MWPYFLTMEGKATENDIMILTDSQEFSISRSICIFFNGELNLTLFKKITATVWLHLIIVYNSWRLSSIIFLSSKSMFLIVESIKYTRDSIEQNAWLSCFGRKTLCRKMLLWHLTKYKVGLSPYSTKCNRLYYTNKIWVRLHNWKHFGTRLLMLWLCVFALF